MHSDGGSSVPNVVYDHCESMFVTSALLRLQQLHERAAAAEEIESAAYRCQDSGTCPLTNNCLHRFPQPAGPAARRGGDNVVYLRPNALRQRVAIEAGSPAGWYRYVGLDGLVLGITSFGASAPAGQLFKHFGLTADSVTARVQTYLDGGT